MDRLHTFGLGVAGWRVSSQPPMSERSNQLHYRLIVFGGAVCALARRLPTDPVCANITRQLARCGPAAGAHYGEARDAESNLDYLHKVKLGLKELRETEGWLITTELVTGLSDVGALKQECSELIAILVTCAAKARRKTRRPRANENGDSHDAKPMENEGNEEELP